MASKWRKAKIALGRNLCVYLPKTLPEEEEEEEHQEGPSMLAGGHRSSDVSSFSCLLSPVAAAATPKSSPLTTTKSSSKNICAICLGTMRPGHGHAIFTAECAHTFHFNCIASSVKHGNQVCPVCRAKWKEVPLQGRTDAPHGKTRINHVDLPHDDAWMSVLHRLPSRNVGNRRITSFPSIPEPGVFNDDEPLGQTEIVKKFTSTDGLDKSCTRPMDLKLYPEVPAVQKSLPQQNFSVLIHLKAPVRSSDHSKILPPSLQTSRAPVDLVTVLDVSGSMAGTKLALLKRAMGFVIQNLGPSDRLSVIAFSSTARRLFPLCKMTDSGRQQALQAVNSLVSNGGTNIAEGLKKGAKVMEDRKEKNPVGSIILLSDGQDTYSLSSQKKPDYQSLLPFSFREGSMFQTPVHAFGFGADHDAASMHSISEASGGTFSFIEAENVIQDAFAQCIGGLLSVVVQDLRIRIECVHPGIHLSSLKAGSYTTQLLNDGKTGSINVGDLYADEVRDFLVVMNIPVCDERKATETTLLKVDGVYKDPVSKETLILHPEQVSIQRPEILVQPQVVAIEVDRQRNRVQAAEAMASAQVAAEQGDLSTAVSILESFRKWLSETTSARGGDQLCIALDAELKEMQDRMASRRTYEVSGRAYVLSGLSSHSWQRATARGHSTDSSMSALHGYQTPSMVDMVTQSQLLVLGGSGSSSQPPVRPARSFTGQLRPR